MDHSSKTSSHFRLSESTSVVPRRSVWEHVREGLTGSSGNHWKRALISRIYPYLLVLFDVALIAGLYVAAVAFNYEGPVWQELSKRVLGVTLLANVVGLFLIGGYNYRVDKLSFRFASEHLIVSVGIALAAITMIYSFLFYGKTLNTARSTVMFPLVAFPVISMCYRYALARIKASHEVGNVFCLIGAGEEAQDLYHRLKGKGTRHHFVVVESDVDRIGNHLIEDNPDSPVIGPLDSLDLSSSHGGKFVESYVVTKDVSEFPKEFASRLAAAKFAGNRVENIDSCYAEELRMVPHGRLSVVWALSSDGFRLNESMIYNRVKRLSDLAAALIGLVLVAPVMGLTALAVRMTSEGPVIFRQQRVGYRQIPFFILKFRTMRVGAHKGAKYTTENDDRFTPIGKFLRKYRLDELPQLWNVLKGDLSLIGPRAEWIDLVDEYEKKFPYYHFRHVVKPGITGWAQVNYPYGANDHDTLEKLNYDLYYVRRFSFFLDVSICVKTLFILTFGMGR